MAEKNGGKLKEKKTEKHKNNSLRKSGKWQKNTKN